MLCDSINSPTSQNRGLKSKIGTRTSILVSPQERAAGWRTLVNMVKQVFGMKNQEVAAMEAGLKSLKGTLAIAVCLAIILAAVPGAQAQANDLPDWATGNVTLPEWATERASFSDCVPGWALREFDVLKGVGEEEGFPSPKWTPPFFLFPKPPMPSIWAHCPTCWP